MPESQRQVTPRRYTFDFLIALVRQANRSNPGQAVEELRETDPARGEEPERKDDAK